MIERLRQLNAIVDYFIQNILPYWKGIVLAGVIIWLLSKILDLILAWASYRSITATIIHKERINYNLSSIYLIYTDKGVFRITDTYAFLRFGASDRYNQCRPGETYQLFITGYRSRFFSEYPNVVRIKNPAHKAPGILKAIHS